MDIIKALSIGRGKLGCQGRRWGSRNLHSLHSSQLVIQISRLAFVVVLRADLLDLSLGQTQLRLAEFNDRAQAQLVPPLRQIVSLRGLVQQLLGEGKTLVGGDDIEPGRADVLCDAVLKVPKKLLLRAGPR